MELDNQAAVLKALGDSYRLQIMHLLKEQQQALSVEEIAAHLKTTTTHSTYHLRQLRTAKLITARKRKFAMYYALEEQAIIEAYSSVHALLPKTMLG